MKKFIAALTLFFACAFSATAQEQKLSSEEKVKIETYKLADDLGLQGKQHEEFVTMMIQKHETNSNPQMSNERKAEMSRIVGERMRTTLTPDQYRKLESHPLMAAPATAAPVKSSR